MGGSAAGDADIAGSRWGWFLEGSYVNGDREETIAENGFDFDATSFTLGVDYLLNSGVVGASIGIDNYEADFIPTQLVNGGSVDVEGQTASVFGALFREQWYFDAILSFGTLDSATERAAFYPSNNPGCTPAPCPGVDATLLGDTEGVQAFAAVMRENRKCATFGIATGRRLDSALTELRQHGIPRPDVLITSLGTEIHYAPRLNRDEYWNEHIDYLWRPAAVRRALAELPGLQPQPRNEQTRFKVSYVYDPDHAPCLDDISSLLRSQDVTANLVYSFGQYLDVIPSRASKGQALRYVAQRWGIPLDHILVAGGSGADEDMMRGNTLAVVVENRHGEELSQLEDLDRIYFAGRPYALGILEAIEHYDFFGSCSLSAGKAGD
jgi:sucrose phosphatase-like protein